MNETQTMLDVDGSEIESNTYPEAHKHHEQWMCRLNGQKTPYAMWTQSDAPAPCNEHGTDCSECECDAAFKWSFEGNYRAFEQAKIPLETDEIAGLTFIQKEADDFIFIDGDDVRCPETGEIHPAFLKVLDLLGVTYSDVSASGAGVHSYYEGDLPGDETTADWYIDDEPWGANEDLPAVEIYSGKHVCVTTGDHLADTPETVSSIDSDALENLLVKNTDYDSVDKLKIDTNTERKGCETKNTVDFDSDDVADDVGECFEAIKSLDARNVADKTIVHEWTDKSRSDIWTFLPIWGRSSDGGTANIVDEDSWTDTGRESGHGGPIEMARIEMGDLTHTQSRTFDSDGNDFWKGYEMLRELGFELPKPPHSKQEEGSDYYDVELNELVPGDVFSDPRSMLDACLKARNRGKVEAGVDPPTLALQAVADEYLDRESDVGDEVTRGQAMWMFRNELTVAEVSGR